MRRQEIISTNPDVLMLTAPNQGPLTLDGTNTYVVGVSPAYIIDPGPALDVHIDAIVETIRRAGVVPRGVLLTHGHPDHADGANRLGRVLRVPVWASAEMASSMAESIGVTDRFVDEQMFDVEGHKLEVVPTPGHSPEHVALWLADQRIAFAGDTILGTGSTLIAPPEGDMLAYVSSLRALQKLNPRLIAPGHGPLVQNPRSRIDEYIEHRREREMQVLSALSDGAASIDEIVRRVYIDVSPSLYEMAAGSVRAQLDKLETEGRVQRAGDLYTLSS